MKNIGPASRFDDGKPDFLKRLKASYNAGNPIIDELKPFVNTNVPQEVYNIRLCEGTDDCIAHPRLISNLLLEKILEQLNLSQLIRSYAFSPHDCTELLLSHKQAIQRNTVGKRSAVFVWIAVRLDASLDSNSWRWSSL